VISLNVGVERKITKHIYLGADIIVPAFTKWNSDEMFIYTFRLNEEQQIARNKSSSGVALSFNYHF
jgi:hypothetical protein